MTVGREMARPCRSRARKWESSPPGRRRWKKIDPIDVKIACTEALTVYVNEMKNGIQVVLHLEVIRRFMSCDLQNIC